MSLQLGKKSIVVGSHPDSDIRLGGPGVAPQHLTIECTHDSQVQLVACPSAATQVGDQLLQVGKPQLLDFRTPVVLGAATALPMTHPALAPLFFRPGQHRSADGTVQIGRDPARCDLVVSHSNVSGVHAQVQRKPLSVTDLDSTSGTWLDKQRIAARNPHQLLPETLVEFGPIAITGQTLDELASASQSTPVDAGDNETSKARAAIAKTSARRPAHKTIIGEFSLGGGDVQMQTIGRTDASDICISHPQVSSRHAILHQKGGELSIEDCGSANGTFVRGKRIAASQRVAVHTGEKVFIGPMPLRIQANIGQAAAVVIEDAPQWEGRPLYEIEAWDLVLSVPDRDNPNTTKVLLDHVSFKALPGDFIALMGPSGAGKTTLLLTLNGYLPPTAGQVRINGEDLYSIYDALRGSIGYVPQDDIVHPELTVWEAVRYSAQFRLPPDFSSAEIDERVITTLTQLGLEGVRHLQIGKPEKKVLSGGQRKRVNIAMELVTDPVLMFLDEPTSGLAADDTTALVKLLSDLAKQTGKTIITTIHQPARDEFEKFNLALVMGHGGLLTFFGPTSPDAYRFFGKQLEREGKPNSIDNPRDMFDMIQQREAPLVDALQRRDPGADRAQARKQAARDWHDDYFKDNHITYQQMYSGQREVGSGSTDATAPGGRPKTRGQFSLLFERYLKIKQRDVSGTAIMLLQAPIIGVLLALVFGGQELAIPSWCVGAIQQLATKSGEQFDASSQLMQSMKVTSDNTAATFFLSVASVWFGTSNAAREIVSERAIYLRERMVNLNLFNYVFSKFVLLSLVTIVQCSVLLGIVFFALGFHGGMAAFGTSLVTLVATAMSSVATGLLLSTLVGSSEAAMALTPIALIPQVVLGGLMVPMTTNPSLQWPMLFMPARWGFQGIVAQERMAVARDPAWVIDLSRPNLNSVDNFISAGKFQCAEAQIASTELNGAWGFVHYENSLLPIVVLGAMMTLTLGAILVLLRRRDRI